MTTGAGDGRGGSGELVGTTSSGGGYGRAGGRATRSYDILYIYIILL